MKFCDVMAYYDYKVINMCNELHVTRETIRNWRNKDVVPFKFQCVIQVLSNGRMVADIEAYRKGQLEFGK